MNANSLVMATGFGSAGVPAGWLGRRVLAGLPRGADVRLGWCVAATAGLWALVGLRFGAVPSWWLPIPVLLGWFTVLLTATDLAHRRLPDVVNLSGFLAVGAALVVASVWGGASIVTHAVLGMLTFGGIHLAVHLYRPAALGAGDVKLSGWLGAVLGVTGWPTMVFATVAAALCSLTLRLAAPTCRDGAPHGPGLLGATWLVATYPAATLLPHP